MLRVCKALVLAPLAGLFLTAAAAAERCDEPLGYVAPQAPIPAPLDELLQRTETIEIEVPLTDLVAALEDQLIEDQAPAESDFPAVIGTVTLTTGGYGDIGSRRLVCLADDTTRLEHVILKETTENTHRFRYQIWSYASKSTESVDYSVGELIYTAISPTRTSIAWTHGFSLREDTLPGALGPVGRWQFRRGFLKKDYKPLMQETLEHMKNTFETATSSIKTEAPSR